MFDPVIPVRQSRLEHLLKCEALLKEIALHLHPEKPSKVKRKKDKK